MMDRTTSRGRGRGSKKHMDLKPGIQASENQSMSQSCSVERLRGLILALSFEPDKFEVLAVQDTLTQLGTSTDIVNEFIQTLLNRCKDNWRFSKSATHCVAICCQEEQLKSIKIQFLKNLQNLYKQKDELRMESQQCSWLGCVALLSQSLIQIRASDGSPMEVLKEPVTDVLELCLSDNATDAEILCASTQELDIGPILSNCLKPEVLQRHKNKVRDIVTEARGPREARFMLIEAAEGYASNWRHRQP